MSLPLSTISSKRPCQTNGSDEGGDGGLSADAVSPAGQKVKKRRTPSRVWAHFDAFEEAGEAICIRCGPGAPARREIATGSSALARHLARGRGIKQGSNAFGNPGQILMGASCNLARPDLLGEAIKQEIAEALTDFIADAKQSFSLAQSSSFRRLCRAKNRLRVAPSRQAIARSIEEEYQHLEGLFKRKISSVQSEMPLTCGGWPSRTMRGHFAAAAHWIDGNWQFRNAMLEFAHFPPPYNQRVLFALLVKILERWYLGGKIRAIAADSGAEMGPGLSRARNCLSNEHSAGLEEDM